MKEKRLEAKMSQKYLSRLSGISQSYISKLEQGLKSPTLRTVNRLAYILDINPLELFK
ncbi:helix-turn-helix domain-containing protein [Clostridium botulinum]|uniref:helix-turn-helix domain-containing protein n=1 Tax=Clostridium botulinum TaxID=1491 RepID=UPI001E4F5A8C|nr:helix-turn-helix transcriptional regulator [Clostridium botulinum]